MLTKQVIGYIPSMAVPALTSFGAVFCYTRLLSPYEYGHYALTLSFMTLLNAVFFYWLQQALPRLMPKASKENKAEELRATTYIVFSASSLIMISCVLLFTILLPEDELAHVAWLAIPLALIRSLLSMNQAFHRSEMNYRQYNIIECGQAILGLGIGLALVYFLHMENKGAVIGLITGMAVMAIADSRMLNNLSFKHFSREAARDIIHFGLPLVFTLGLAMIISTSDRFFIQYFYGPADVGIYAAGYSVMDRITTIIFMVVAFPSFSLTIHKLENEGLGSARAQTYSNGAALLALAIPACAGLVLTSEALATVFIGEEFREGAMRVMPWIAVSAILNGFATHYFDHAFYYGKKLHMLFFTQGPAAICNLILNYILIPRYGYMGAAYATFISYALLLILSIIVGRRAFPIHFPVKPASQIALSTILMIAVLEAIAFPADLLGLSAMCAIGGITYGLGILAFNVMDIRSKLLSRAGIGKAVHNDQPPAAL